MLLTLNELVMFNFQEETWWWYIYTYRQGHTPKDRSDRCATYSTGGVTHVVAVHAFVIPAKIKVDFLLKFMLIFVSEKNFSLLWE